MGYGSKGFWRIRSERKGVKEVKDAREAVSGVEGVVGELTSSKIEMQLWGDLKVCVTRELETLLEIVEMKSVGESRRSGYWIGDVGMRTMNIF
jgi:hypothetical protein